MSDKLMQPTSEMINSINSLNMLRSNLLPIQDNQQSFQQQQNTLGQYLATIQYLTKQQQQPQPNQFNQQNQNLNNLNNLDNLLVQQHQVRQQLMNGQNNSNGNSPLSMQSLPDHDNYVDVINNLQRQQLLNQQQIEQNIMKNQIIKGNLIRNDKQELMSKTIGNQLHNQINQINNLNEDKFINYQQQLNILNNQQQIIQSHQPEKYTSSPLMQIAQMTVIDSKPNNLKCLELSNKKPELNKSNELRQLKHHFHSNSSNTRSAIKPINKKENGVIKNELTHNSSDQNNNSTTMKESDKQIAGVVGIEEQTGKPFHNYIALIGMAILNSKDKRLVLSEIYAYILENYEFYRAKSSGWRNSIRHNLSLNDCFVKGPKAANGKGHYWFIHPACRRDFEKGDFNRRRAQRKVRKHLGLRMLDCRLNDEDPDSDDEEMKQQFLSNFHHLQQLHLQQNLHNFQNNLYLNNLNLNNPNSPTSSLTAPNLNCSSLNTSEEYLSYLALMKRNWLNSLTPLNNQNLEIKPNSNLAIQYSSEMHPSSLNSTSNSLNDQNKKEEINLRQLENPRQNKDEDDFVMVDVDVEAGTNQECLKNKKITEECFEMIEVEQVNDQTADKKGALDDQTTDKILMDLNLIKKIMKDCTSLNDTNLRSKHKFDVDSLLKSEDVKSEAV